MGEGFVNKVKWLKRRSSGQAGFALLPGRLLLHPEAWERLSNEQRRRSSRKSVVPSSQERGAAGSTPLAGAAA
jgi:hypothetical protein